MIKRNRVVQLATLSIWSCKKEHQPFWIIILVLVTMNALLWFKLISNESNNVLPLNNPALIETIANQVIAREHSYRAQPIEAASNDVNALDAINSNNNQQQRNSLAKQSQSQLMPNKKQKFNNLAQSHHSKLSTPKQGISPFAGNFEEEDGDIEIVGNNDKLDDNLDNLEDETTATTNTNEMSPILSEDEEERANSEDEYVRQFIETRYNVGKKARFRHNNVKNLIYNNKKPNNYVPENWRINWSHLKSTLLENDDTRRSRQRALQHKRTMYAYFGEFKRLIKWNNPNYIGHCRSYFYPYVAFLNKYEISELNNLYDFDINSNFDLFNTSVINKDLARANFFSLHFPTQWRFGSTVIINDPIRQSLVLEIVIIGNSAESIQKTFRQSDRASDYTNRFLCVFSDGTVILSLSRLQGAHYGFVIQCDISKSENLKQKILDQVSKFSNLNGSNASEQQKITNIGVTLFSLDLKQSQTSLMVEYLVSANVQLPVCAYVEANRRPKIYTSEFDYHYSNESLTSDVFVNVRDSEKENINDKKYFLTASNTIHPASRSGQMDILTLQWIDYHLFQGFDHMYLYVCLHFYFCWFLLVLSVFFLFHFFFVCYCFFLGSYLESRREKYCLFF